MIHSKPFVTDYLRKLPIGKWIEIRSLPHVIGMPGIIEAQVKQVLKPEFEILIGRLYCTFKIIRTQTEAMHIINRIRKAV